MRFNAKKCYILSISKKGIQKFYQLDSTILKEVENNPYLGLTLSNDLKWSTHINKISNKASSTLGLIQRNLKECPPECKAIGMKIIDSGPRPHFGRVASS